MQSGARQRHRTLFFSTPELAQRLHLVRHLVEDSDLIPLVKGVAGAGKTRLLHHLQASAGEHWDLCRVDANPLLHPDQLLTHCARLYGLAEADAQVWGDLIRHFERRCLAGRLPVIVVDDAQLLPPDTLVLLLRLHEKRAGDFPLVRVVLFADPLIDTLLAVPPLQNMNLQPLHTLEVPALKAQEIPLFVNHVLGARGRAERIPMPAFEVGRLYRESGGVPGRLVALLKNGPPAQTVDKAGTLKRLPKGLLVGVGLGALAVLLMLIYQDEINQLFVPIGDVERDSSLPEMDAEAVAPPFESAPRLARDAQMPNPFPHEFMPSLPSLATSPIAMAQWPVSSGSASPEIDHTTSANPLASVAERETEAVAPGGTEGESPEPGAFAAQLSPELPPQKAQPAPAGSAERYGVAQPTASSVGPSRSDLKGAADPQPAPAATADSESRGEAWLLRQQADAYTLQLMGVRDAAALPRLIQRHGIQDQAVYFETLRDGKPWYSLIYGVFPDRNAAVAGRANLPQKLRKKEPWVRRLDAIQQEIRSRQP